MFRRVLNLPAVILSSYTTTKTARVRVVPSAKYPRNHKITLSDEYRFTTSTDRVSGIAKSPVTLVRRPVQTSGNELLARIAPPGSKSLSITPLPLVLKRCNVR